MSDDEKTRKLERLGHLKDEIMRWLEYAYFLRFPLLFSLLLPLLCVLDATTGFAILTRGIMTVDSGMQAFFAAFFIVAYQMTALITARNIVRNGNERFDATPPTRLMCVIKRTTPATMWTVLGVAQFPGLLALVYAGLTAKAEGEKLSVFGIPESGNIGMVWVYFALGIIVALVFWYLVSLFYYWVYRNPNRQRAAALIFPEYELFTRLQASQPPPRFDWAIMKLYWLLKWTVHGYAEGTDGPFYELQVISAIGYVGYLLLYLFLYPLTAPVARHSAFEWGTLVALVMSGIFLLLTFGWPKATPAPGVGLTPVPEIGVELLAEPVAEMRTEPESQTTATGVEANIPLGKVKLLFRAIAVAPVVIYGVNLIWATTDAEHAANFLSMAFPALASIVVILTLTLWFLTSLSFFFDRYRVPVLGTFLVALIGFNLIATDDHYYAARDNKGPGAVRTPKEILESRMPLTDGKPDETPAIIVTAAGGGIHAAAWTADILAELENQFDADDALQKKYKGKNGYTFHDHLMLASTVSGGSVGAVPYLLEYTGDQQQAFIVGKNLAGWGAFHARVTSPPACSGLEAAAWGLEYYDLYRLVLGWFPAPTHFAEGEEPDRSWALGAAFGRNLTDHHCGEMQPLKDSKGETFTLGAAAAMLAKEPASIPAFTFNTTAAETGGRFLLANYYVPPDTSEEHSDFVPAESFLNAYGGAGNPHAKRGADIALPIAARLSATFPYVTSGTRLPTRYNDKAFHFLDGGYFDNDGTGSVIEFLRSALGQSAERPPCPPCEGQKDAEKRNTAGQKAGKEDGSPDAKKRRNILLIEIRDGDDIGTLSQETLKEQNDKGWTWKLLDQLGAPPKGLYAAGHESVTRRNRRELCLLEDAYKDQLNIYHVVFTIDTQKNQPLSWNLTARERQKIDDWVSPPGPDSNEKPPVKPEEGRTAKTMKLVLDWMENPGSVTDDSCRVFLP
jgi:hypothetical protein